MVKKWYVVLIEDERNARDYLKNTLLTRYNDIEVVGEAETVQQALDLFSRVKFIHGAFIDINLGSDGPRAGLDLAFNLSRRDNAPWVIFATAYDEAIPAINDVHPIGYLLKPLDFNKLDAVLDYMRKIHGKKPPLSNHDELHIEIRYSVISKSGDKKNKERCICFIKPSEIVYARKNSNSASIHIRLVNGKLLDGITGTLTEWHKKLNTCYFMQIHRGHLANIRQAQSIHPHPCSKETYQLSFKCCIERLTIGGEFYEQVVEKLQCGEAEESI